MEHEKTRRRRAERPCRRRPHAPSPGVHRIGGASVAPASSDVAARRALGLDGRFARDGEVWIVALGAESARVRDSKGMRQLARLLATPDREIHVLDLEGPSAPGPGPVARDRAGGADGSTGGGGLPLLDARAKAAYRARLTDIDDDLAAAEAANDGERAARARVERDFLVDELARAVGLGGRDRVTGSPSERARVNVNRTLKAAIDRIAGAAPALADHLRARVSTGTFCSYSTGQAEPVRWILGTGPRQP